jgi:manganese-dependent inorganic pyrophosphatase
VGQITCVNSEHILKRKFEFIMEMQAAVDKRKYDMVLLMLTDVLLEGTQLLYLGDEDIIRAAFSSDAKNHSVFLPKVMSRKKQIIPALSAMWG